MAEEQAKSITLQVPVHDISPQFSNELERILQENPGKAQLKVHLSHKDQAFDRALSSRKKVSISNELIKELELLGGYRWKIN